MFYNTFNELYKELGKHYQVSSMDIDISHGWNGHNTYEAGAEYKTPQALIVTLDLTLSERPIIVNKKTNVITSKIHELWVEIPSDANVKECVKLILQAIKRKNNPPPKDEERHPLMNEDKDGN